MAIKIEKTFTIDAPAEAVWTFLIDPRRVAGCLPGASITEQIDETTYAGKMTIKVGPVSASYKGKITFERLDAEQRRAELSGRGQDIRGRGGVDMRMISVVREGDAGTEVTVESEVNVSGILAQFGGGMIVDVSDQLFQTFADRMQAELSAVASPAETPNPSAADSASADPVPQQEDALDVVSLGAKASARAALRVLRRPAFWIATVIGGLLAYLVFI